MIDTKSFIKEMFDIIFYLSFWNPVCISQHISIQTRYISSAQQADGAFWKASEASEEPVCLQCWGWGQGVWGRAVWSPINI